MVDTEMLAFVFDNWLEICFFMVPSIRVAHLLAYCVLIGSLADLYLAFACGMCWHVADGWCYHWQGDIINGRGCAGEFPARRTKKIFLVPRTVRLTSIHYRVFGNHFFCFAPTETIDWRVKKIRSPTCGMVWWSVFAEIYLVVDYLGIT
jgi:hypothetical protein